MLLNQSEHWRGHLDRMDTCIPVSYGLVLLDSVFRASSHVSLDQLTFGKLSHTPADVKQLESSGRASGLPGDCNDRRTETQQFTPPGDAPY
jgi:hypothetical protein